MIKVGIIGGGGYTAGELLRILINHPKAEISFVNSKSQAGKLISEVHQDLIGETWLKFTESFHTQVDVLFLCQGHGQSKQILKENEIPDSVSIIDLSRDFRLEESFVYGLPELNKERIKKSKRIANCGCFATAIQLGLLPMAFARSLDSEVHIHAITGSTGAGQSPKPTTHFSWRNNNLSIYKPFKHQHLDEINRSLVQLQPNFDQAINFIPVRGDFARGIFASMYFDTEYTEQELLELYSTYYAEEPFVLITEQNPSLKQVVNTNKCVLHIEKHRNKALIISLIDNLVKGASGQAVQNMNLSFGFKETLGLSLKAMAF
ncbi:MAG: N-acetyl-gamma-glutamyl-phosphate reductase [Bacteroidota bacterium]